MSDRTTFGELVGSTSRWTAGLRAWESQREDRLFEDPWAAALAGKEGTEWAEQRARSEDNGLSIVVRTRFFDDFLQSVTGQHTVRQVVLLAAGLDTRAFRLSWPSQTQLFELDQPHVLKYKNQVLHSAGADATCERKALEVDLTGAWKETLLAAGFDAQQPSCWLVEGILYYLDNASIVRLLDSITDLAVPGSWIGFDITNSAMLNSPLTQELNERLARSGVPWIGSIDDPADFLAQRGWRATLVPDSEIGTTHGRQVYPLIPPQTSPEDFPYHWYVTGSREG